MWVSEVEIGTLAQHLEISDVQFRRRWTREELRGVSLTEKPNYDCIFLEIPGRCQVYAVRPRQCRTWPFWRSVLRDQESWDASARNCPGMNAGRLHTVEEIEAICHDDGLPD